MKVLLTLFLGAGLFFLAFQPLQAAVVRPVKAGDKPVELTEKQQERLDKQLKKLEHKIAKKKAKAEKRGDVWDDGKFRLGVLLLALAIGLGIVALIISLGGLINFIAGLFALGGVILVIWSIVENYS